MDPRHPELAIERIDELMAQYKDILSKMRTCNVSTAIGGMERECGLVVQEICLVAPRLHEAMMQVSRTRRAALARGIVLGYTPEEKVGEYTKATIGIDSPENTSSYEIPTPPNQAEVEIAEIKPRKKKTTKKKKAE